VGRDAVGRHPRLENGLLAPPVGLARPERDRPAVRHEERIERVDEVGRGGLDLEDVDSGTEADEGVGEGVVLALRELEVDEAEEPVRGIVERASEGGAGALDEDRAERRGHALRQQRTGRRAAVEGHRATARASAALAPLSGAIASSLD
jgi:hypothetical protein